MNSFTVATVRFEWHLFANLGVFYNSFDHKVYTFTLWNHGETYEINLHDTTVGNRYVITWNKSECCLREILQDIAQAMLEQRGVFEYE